MCHALKLLRQILQKSKPQQFCMQIFCPMPFTLFRLGFFGVPGPGGGRGLHKSESIDAIVMKLGG